MQRKEFLKLSSSAVLGTPFLLNGMLTRAMSNYMDIPINCDNVNDRVLIIVRLAGANDGLNTLIPVSQYDTYSNLRPDLRIMDTGSNSYINIDNTLSDNKLSGLHPTLTGFKNLYDNGKMGILNGVGYPSPNYSHFKGENTMFSGKDGNTNNELNSGIFGRYLSELYPGLAGYPTVERPDPLAIQLGNTNPNLFYGHSHEIGIEYNITNFHDTLISSRTLSTSSEYNELIDYILTVEGAMDSYYNRIFNVYNSGTNSSVDYPDSSLAKQLKTVARLIKGGSKTKIFQVTIGGFDTHVKQVVIGNSHIGRHQRLLNDLSTSVTAFQNDIETLGISDKIMTVTFSEFGRQVRQNGNSGTDHGNISPFFVIGSSVNPGIYEDHPKFSNSLDFQYDESQRRYDYRQLFASLMQDWLGANDIIMDKSELAIFSSASQKIPIINSKVNAYPNCLIGTLDCLETHTAIKVNENEGWSYYAPSGYTGNQYLFAIEHIPSDTGSNTLNFEVVVKLIKKCNSNYSNVFIKSVKNTGEGIFGLGSYWNIKIIAGSTDGWVNLRWFTDANLEKDLQIASNNFVGDSESTYLSPKLHLKSNTPLQLPDMLSDNGSGLKNGNFTSLSNQTNGSYLGFDYVQYNKVNSIDNNGGGIFIKATNFDDNTPSLQPIDPEKLKGSIRYNNGKIEGFNGTIWVKFHD